MARHAAQLQGRALSCMVLALGAGLGCDPSLFTDAFEIDPNYGDAYPIALDLSHGAVVVGLSDGETIGAAVLDTGTPISVWNDSMRTVPLRRSESLTVHAMPQGQLGVARARVTSNLLRFPACQDGCKVGIEPATRTVTALLGADALVGETLQLRVAERQARLLPRSAGDTEARTAQCEAVFPSPFRGGGTMIVHQTEIGYGGLRPAVNACLAPTPELGRAAGDHGTDALLVISTAIGPTLLSNSAYARYLARQPSAPALASLPMQTLWYFGMAVTGRATTLPALALTGNHGAGRGACRDFYAHTLLAQRDCLPEDDCPCRDFEECGAPAIVELASTPGLTVLVIDDETPLLQALRAELRPDQAEIDGLLGTDALALLALDFDYDGNRLVMACQGPTGCRIRPILEAPTSRIALAGCLSAWPPAVQ